MENRESEIKRVWNLAVFLQMMAAFCQELDSNIYRERIKDLNRQIDSNDQEVIESLVSIEGELWSIARPLLKRYPLKRKYEEIATDWDNQFRKKKDFINYGLSIGWLEKQLDLKNFYRYDYYPYHFKIGLGIHKGFGEIEENFLLKDSFSCLIKANVSLQKLKQYVEIHRKELESKNHLPKNSSLISNISNLKYEVCLYSRLSVISFFSFLECYVNSIGYDYFCRNQATLSENESELLQGTDNNGYIPLKKKIEKFQKLILSDKKVQIVLTDSKQISDPFKTLFEDYAELRNSAIHYSPNKQSIWLDPNQWAKKANSFSKLAVEAALILWKVLHNTNKGPDYLGRLDYERLYDMAKERQQTMQELKYQ